MSRRLWGSCLPGHAAREPALLAVLALVGALTSCGGDGPLVVQPPSPPPPPGQLPESALLFLRPAPGAPALMATDTTVVATRGERLKVEIFYEPEPGSGADRGERFLRFELEENSLLRYPQNHPRAGALFQDGDTISIRITVEEGRLLAEFQPSGLQFDPLDPAELELRYPEADDDYDGDGDSDPERESEIDLWRQENPGDPWVRIGELKSEDLDEVEARLLSFTRYALAI